jgi:hypothetical protein
VSLTRRQLLARGTSAAAGVAVARASAVPLGAVAATGGRGVDGREVDGAQALAAAHRGARAAGAGDYTVAAYLAFMDAVIARIHSEWSTTVNAYRAPGGTYSTVINARMLQVHAQAAASGHEGASRDDERARLLVATLLESPVPFRVSGAGVPHEKMFHLPGWITSLTDPDAVMDKAVDPQVAQALTGAWRARSVLGLDAETVQQIVQAVSSTARCAFFRYPGIRLNQLNWNCALYALDAELTSASDLLRGDYREQLLRFATFATRAQHREGSPNLGPGWHFDYLPNHPPSSMANLDSAEYANEVLDCVRHYSVALAAGMQPLPGWALDVLRAYARRTLYGDWTHSGYLNWDTGLGAQRRYIGKVFAFAQQGLLALAISPVAQSVQGMGAHARWLFDRGLDLYLRWLSECPAGEVPAPVQFGDDEHRQGPDDRLLFAARIASNAAQAIALDVLAVPGAVPPPMYSYDPDTQRLAISTPSYATAILVHNRRAVPYGGLDLNRLFDGRCQPVGCIAGTGIANFLARIRDRGGSELLSTQLGEDASLSMVASSEDGQVRRAGPTSAPYPREAYAGPMRSVQAEGRAARGAAAIATRHLFLPGEIHLEWELTLPRAARWELALPSYGPLAELLAQRSAGQVRLARSGAAQAAAGVRQVLVRSEGGSYAIVPLRLPSGARLRAVPAPGGTGAARPGPTLLVEGPAGSARAHSVSVALLLRVS